MLRKYRHGLFFLLVVSLLTPVSIFAQTELSAREIARRSLPSVGLILCDDGRDVVLGSGFFIKPTILVTNFHVVEGMNECLVQVTHGTSKRKLNLAIVRIIAADREADLAILAVPDAKSIILNPLSLAPESYKIEVGENVFVIGNPEGLDGTISPGIVSAGLRLSERKARIQITAPISHGSSGGPVVNGTGKVIGVAVSSLSDGQNLNFAVPVALLYDLSRKSGPPTTGKALAPATSPPQDSSPEAVDTNRNASGRNGIIITDVPSGSPSIANDQIDAITEEMGDAAKSGRKIVPKSAKRRDTAPVFFYRGIDNFNNGRYADAISDFTRSMRLNPRLAENYSRRGLAYMAQKNFALAIADFTKAITLKPNEAANFNSRGGAYEGIENPDDAISDYTQAISLNSNFASPYRNRGRIYLKKTEMDLAIADFTKSIRLDPRNSESFLLRGNAHLLRNDIDSAVSDYSMAITLDSRFVDALVMRGTAYYRSSRLELALNDYAAALEIRPGYSQAYNNRGLVYIGERKYELAIADFTKAIQFDGRNFEAFRNRAQIYDKLINPEAAISDYTRAIELRPNELYLYFARAQSRLYVKDGDGSFDDAKHYLAQAGKGDEFIPYTMIVGYLGARKSGKNAEAKAFLDGRMVEIDTGKWTTQILLFLAGRLSWSELLAKATDNDKLTEAHAYIGEKLLLDGDRKSATLHFQWVKYNGNKDFTEYNLAISELTRLE